MRKDRLMIRHSTNLVLYGVIALSALVSSFVLPGTSDAQAAEETEAEEPAGQQVFLAHKCNLCHSVPAAGIEAKTKSEKMKGADLGGPVKEDFEVIAGYLRKQSELEGKNHKKEFTGSDEELHQILDWLAELAPVNAEDS